MPYILWQKAIKFLIMKISFVLVIILLMMNSCYVIKEVPTDKNIFDAYIGISENELMMEFGAPDRIVDDKNGGEIYVYEKGVKYTELVGQRRGNIECDPIYENRRDVSDDFIVSKREKQEYVQFFINADGKVYHYLSNYGYETKPERVFDLGRTLWLSIGIPTFVIPLVLLFMI